VNAALPAQGRPRCRGHSSNGREASLRRHFAPLLALTLLHVTVCIRSLRGTDGVSGRYCRATSYWMVEFVTVMGVSAWFEI
jgi:hypothetical protein